MNNMGSMMRADTFTCRLIGRLPCGAVPCSPMFLLPAPTILTSASSLSALEHALPHRSPRGTAPRTPPPPPPRPPPPPPPPPRPRGPPPHPPPPPPQTPPQEQPPRGGCPPGPVP